MPAPAPRSPTGLGGDCVPGLGPAIERSRTPAPPDASSSWIPCATWPWCTCGTGGVRRWTTPSTRWRPSSRRSDPPARGPCLHGNTVWLHTHASMARPLWGSRVQAPLTPTAARISSSIDVDRPLAAHDVAAPRAHVDQLHAIGLVDDAGRDRLLRSEERRVGK